MSDKQHIISRLAEKAFSELNQAEIASIEDHIGSCDNCLRAYQAARLSSKLLKARAAETIEPSPFFQSRVMAALKAQRRPEESLWQRWWRAAGLVVASMVAIVVILLILNLQSLSSSSTTNSSPKELTATLQPTDTILLGDSSWIDEDVSNNQILTTVFEPEDSYGNDK